MSQTPNSNNNNNKDNFTFAELRDPNDSSAGIRKLYFYYYECYLVEYSTWLFRIKPVSKSNKIKVWRVYGYTENKENLKESFMQYLKNTYGDLRYKEYITKTILYSYPVVKEEESIGVPVNNE